MRNVPTSDSTGGFELATLNPSNRCPVALLLDTSTSMAGGPIAELAKGLEAFISEVNTDRIARNSVELSVITFGEGGVQLRQRFTEMAKLVGIDIDLVAGGNTPLGGAVNLALSELKSRRDWYSRQGLKSYRPWVIIISDGAPNDDWHSAASALKRVATEKKMMVLAICVEGADAVTLSQFTAADCPPQALLGLKFSEFFKWLTDSLVQTTTRSSPSASPGSTALPNPSGWLKY